MVMVDGDWRVTHVNAHAAELLARSAAELLGSHLWTAFPSAIGTIFQSEPQRAVAEGTTRRFTAFFEPIGAWLAVRAVPVAGGVAVFFSDVTEYKRAELR